MGQQCCRETTSATVVETGQHSFQQEPKPVAVVPVAAPQPAPTPTSAPARVAQAAPLTPEAIFTFKNADGTVSEITFKKGLQEGTTRRDHNSCLGMRYKTNVMPATIVAFPAGGNAERLGVQLNSVLMKVNGKDYSGANFETLDKAVKDAAATLPKTPSVKVFAMPPSANAMGPVLLAMDSGAGGFEMCNIAEGAQMKPDFLAMNPFHHIPTLKDGDFAIAEGSSCLRYLALKYKPAYYPVGDAAACGWIDFAMDSFTGDVYPKWCKIVYPVLGFSGPTEDMPKAIEEAKAITDTWVTHFLKGKFVNGNSLCIADFKVAPFLFYFVQPGIEKQGFLASDRVKQYCEDFIGATAASAMMKSAGGFAMAEFCASKVPDAEKTAKPFSKPTIAGKPAFGATSGIVKVFGMPPSCNAMGPVLMAMDAGCGGFEMCNLQEGAHMTPEFLAMNPFHHIPTLKDGEYAIAESSTSIRYLALKYKPEYYPTQDPQTCGMIDFAMDSFAGDVYPAWCKVCYPLMGFSGPTEDPPKAATELTEMLNTWCTHFLKGKFVNGNGLSIADFKVGPFFFALTQPGIAAKAGFTPSERVKKYAQDFVAASPACAMLSEAGGFSVKEYIAMKAAA